VANIAEIRGLKVREDKASGGGDYLNLISVAAPDNGRSRW